MESIYKSVQENKNYLQSVKEYRELTRWGRENGATDGKTFNAYKLALMSIKVDYNKMRSEKLAKEEKELEKKKDTNETVTLFVDGCRERKTFMVMDERKTVTWRGWIKDEYSIGEYELKAARKAVWATKEYMNISTLSSLNLILKMEKNTLSKNEVEEIVSYAKRYKIVMEVKFFEEEEFDAMCKDISEDHRSSRQSLDLILGMRAVK